MCGAEVNRFKAVLTTKLAELLSGWRNREEISIDNTADLLDQAQLASERELAIGNLDRESKLLRNVRSALARIENDCFGTCLRCEERISPKRLEAVAWAAYCLDCQDAVDDQRALRTERPKAANVNNIYHPYERHREKQILPGRIRRDSAQSRSQAGDRVEFKSGKEFKKGHSAGPFNTAGECLFT
jgi:DnaK suppressor protein